MIRCICPRCKRVLDAPDDRAGTEWMCMCGKSLMLPKPAPPPPFPPRTPVQASAPVMVEPISAPPPPIDLGLQAKFDEVAKAFQADPVKFAIGGLMVAGILIVLFFFVVYDTTVGVDTYIGMGLYQDMGERVYNVGRMSNRLVGIIFGFGLLGTGIALLVFRAKK